MDGATSSKRDIKNHVLFEIATEVANRGKTGSLLSLELTLTHFNSGRHLLCS